MTDERFTIDETDTERILEVANWWATVCREAGREPPQHPLEAILEAAELLYQRSRVWQAACEFEFHKAQGGRTQ
ncbi:MAG: hypothetical protein OXE57_14825 [Alphaproteobacteria bacterium]|nr:hypothetical protein [Alphaproteobacteria bacterium]